ncbi:hypothetical protein [Hydrogenophaga sp. 5NK40-0174]|uniref:hypothetical protein n=1 Tax=Hydrogenophaga sp. 5NK40-0174 TaxID=3127649 RepID=UPI0031043185
MYDKDGRPIVIPMKERPAARRFFATSHGWAGLGCFGAAILFAFQPSSTPSGGRTALFSQLIHEVLGPMFGGYAYTAFFAIAGLGFAWSGVRKAMNWTESVNWK